MDNWRTLKSFGFKGLSNVKVNLIKDILINFKN